MNSSSFLLKYVAKNIRETQACLVIVSFLSDSRANEYLEWFPKILSLPPLELQILRRQFKIESFPEGIRTDRLHDLREQHKTYKCNI